MFIGGELGVVWSDGAAEEGHRTVALVEYCAKPAARRVAVDVEALGEVG